MVCYVSDCFINQIENLPVESIDSRFQMIEQRLQLIENNLHLPGLKAQRTPPFISQEVENFNEFIKAIFRKEVKRKGYSLIK